MPKPSQPVREYVSARPEQLYVVGLSLAQLEAVRDALDVARIVARERVMSTRAFAESAPRVPHFWSKVEQYWMDRLGAAEIAAEAIERAAPGERR